GPTRAPGPTCNAAMQGLRPATFESPAVGQPLGQSYWLPVSQDMIDAFAATTGDRQWIHVDVERARREAPGVARLLRTGISCCLCSGYCNRRSIPRRRAGSLIAGLCATCMSTEPRQSNCG